MYYMKLFIRWLDLYKWRILIAGALILFSIILVTEPFWFIAAADSLRIPYAIFLIVFITFFFIRGNNALTSGAVIALLILGPGIWKYFRPSEETPFEKKEEKKEIPVADFSVLHFNVKENNKQIISVAEAALQSGADIVSMQELKESSLRVIDTIMQSRYPYALTDIRIKGL